MENLTNIVRHLRWRWKMTFDQIQDHHLIADLPRLVGMLSEIKWSTLDTHYFKPFHFETGNMFIDCEPIYHWIRAEFDPSCFLTTHDVGQREHLLSELFGVKNARTEHHASLKAYGLTMPLNTSEDDFQKTWHAAHASKMQWRTLTILDWTGKAYLSLADGSHRLAASQRQDIAENRQTRFCVSTEIKTLNHQRINQVLDGYTVLLVYKENFKSVKNAFDMCNIPLSAPPNTYRTEAQLDATGYPNDSNSDELPHRTVLASIWIKNPLGDAISEIFQKIAGTGCYFDISKCIRLARSQHILSRYEDRPTG